MINCVLQLLWVLASVMVWYCETVPVGGTVGGASHARQGPVRTLQLHMQEQECESLIHFVLSHNHMLTWNLS